MSFSLRRGAFQDSTFKARAGPFRARRGAEPPTRSSRGLADGLGGASPAPTNATAAAGTENRHPSQNALPSCVRASRMGHPPRLGFQDVQEFARVVVEAREDGTQIAGPEVFGNDFAEDAAKVSGDGQVAILVELLVTHARPFGVNVAALHLSAHHEHGIRVTVVGAAVAVFVRGASEFRHADENDVVHLIAHVLMERSEALAEIAQQIGELTFDAAFVDVIVPAAAIE